MATADYQLTSLGLRGGDLEVVLILPTDFAVFEAGLTPATIADMFSLMDGSTSTMLDLSVPKFELDNAFDLSDELASLGLVAPFSDKTSFDGIHEQLDVLEVIVHNTVIKVDEEGIEAAAASGFGGDGDGDPDPNPPALMVLDRPFLLAVRDRPTNTLLFFGRVLDPS